MPDIMRDPWSGNTLKPRVITHALGLCLFVCFGALIGLTEIRFLKWLGVGNPVRAIMGFLSVVPLYFAILALWNKYIFKILATRLGGRLLFKQVRSPAPKTNSHQI